MPTLKQRAYRYIRQAMSEGVLSAGDRLSPAALAKEIGISHIPVREAISQLYSEGLVEQLPRRGAFVRRPGREELVELIAIKVNCFNSLVLFRAEIICLLIDLCAYPNRWAKSDLRALLGNHVNAIVSLHYPC